MPAENTRPAEAAPGTGRRLLVVQAAALGLDFSRRNPDLQELLKGMGHGALRPPFPAVTSTASATFRTASAPSDHGLVANGWLDRVTHRTAFWEQSADLVTGNRIWAPLRARGGRVAMLFWQQSLGEDVDIVVSPAPIHKHGGGMVDTCYSSPPGLYEALARELRQRFKLGHYWGPLASAEGSNWIARATAIVLAGTLGDPPDLCLTYLPALDYDLQRHGPDHPKSLKALQALADDLRLLREACEHHNYDMLVWGDYAIAAATGTALLPNRVLRKAGLLRTRDVGGRLYADLHTSRAFACVDHQIAHIYVRQTADVRRVRDLLSACGTVHAREKLPDLNHPRSGELILAAPPGRWLAYPWWETRREAPDYAGHVDIHNKPGFDPCELFFGWPPGSVGLNPDRIRGVHGLEGKSSEACWFATFLPPRDHTLRSLAEATKRHLETIK